MIHQGTDPAAEFDSDDDYYSDEDFSEDRPYDDDAATVTAWPPPEPPGRKSS